MQRLALVTAPTTEPVTLADATTHLRVDDATDDTLIALLLSAARQWVEEECRRSLMPQTWRATLSAFPRFLTRPEYLQGGQFPGAMALLERRFPERSILLPRGPVSAITSIKYIDPSGAQQTLGAGLYTLDAASLPAAAVLAYGQSWPETQDLGPHGTAVTVDYTTGYADAASVPAPLKAAILLVLGDLYANRERHVVGAIVTENPTARLLMGPYLVPEAV